MEVITNLLCLGAMFISVPVVNSVDDHTWYLITLLPVAMDDTIRYELAVLPSPSALSY